MLTTHPSIMLGSYAWDEDLAPRDEFDIRLAALRGAMEKNGWRAAMVYGDAREHGWLAWLTNYIPRMRWALALFRPDADPLLLISMSSRDVPAMRRLTWIQNVRTGWEWKWFDEWSSAIEAGAIGTLGFDLMTPLLFESVERSLAGRFTLANGDDELAGARRLHRPRETALMRKAAEICSAAAESILEAQRSGADVESAALAGERRARKLAAQDVRTLISRDGGRTLEPYRAKFDDRPRQLLAYIAVKYLGYWSEIFVNSKSKAEERARLCLSAVLAETKIGAPLSRLGGVARRALDGGALHPALGDSVGQRIGLSLSEGERVWEQAETVIEPDVVYSFRVGQWTQADGGAIASAILLARPGGGVELLTQTPVV